MELEEQFTKVMRTNVLSNIHLFNSFMPQVLKGKVKKVITISSGIGDNPASRDNIFPF